MTGSEQLSRVTPYVRRLLDDQYIQDQIGEALAGLRQSSSRARGRSVSAALEDRRLRKQLKDAVGSLTRAVRALNEPEPPKRHLVRRALMLAAAAGGAAFAWQRRSGWHAG